MAKTPSKTTLKQQCAHKHATERKLVVAPNRRSIFNAETCRSHDTHQMFAVASPAARLSFQRAASVLLEKFSLPLTPSTLGEIFILLGIVLHGRDVCFV